MTHTHITRDIKPPGWGCPDCDAYHWRHDQENSVKIYEKSITDLRRQLYAVHEGAHAGTVRIVAVGRPEKEIELDAVAARQLRDALTAFLDEQA